MDIENNIKLRIITIFACLCLGFCLIIKVLFGLDERTLITYLFSQIFFVFLPGICIVFNFFNRKSCWEAITLGYAIGYGINILEYLVIYTLNLEKWSSHILIVVAVILVVLLFTKKNNVCFDFNTDESFFLLFLVYLLINIVAYSGNAVSPWSTAQGVTELPRDVQFWCSNAVSLKNSFLPNATFLTGSKLYYHYFSSLHIGFLSRLTGIDVFSLAFTLYPFGKCLIFVGAINYLLNQLKVENLKIFLMATILFMTGKEAISIVTYTWSTIENPFGCDLGIAFGIWYIATFVELIKKDKFEIPFVIINLLMWLVCSGVKAPIASVLIFVPFFFCCAWLVKGKFIKAFAYGGAIVGIFLLINIICAGMFRMFSEKTTMRGGKIGIKLYPLESIIKYSKMGDIVGVLHAVLYEMYYAHPVLFIISLFNFVILIVLALKKQITKDVIFNSIAMLVTTIIGNVMCVFIDAGGHSEIYFTMASFITAVTFNGIVVKEWFDTFTEKNQIKIRLIKATSTVLALYGAFLLVFTSNSGGLLHFLNEGYNRIVGYGGFSEESYYFDEANASKWIRENTDENSIVINDRDIIGYDAGDYYCGIFSERPQYMESADLIFYVDMDDSSLSITDEVYRRVALATALFANDYTVVNTLKNEGVTYIIQNSRVTPDFQCNDKFLKPVYSSGGSTVYRIL